MKNHTFLIIALALVACGKSEKKSGTENAEPVEGQKAQKGESGEATPSGGGEMKAPSFDCGTLVTAEEVEAACSAKATIKKLPTEGQTEAAGSSKLLHVCHRDLEFGPESHTTVAVNFVGGAQTGEELVRANMEAAGSAGWAKRASSMTGYVGRPPSTDADHETAELHGVVRGTMLVLTSTHKTSDAWGCNEAGLEALAKTVADRMPAAPSRE
jgi:hypothetical protein